MCQQVECLFVFRAAYIIALAGGTRSFTSFSLYSCTGFISHRSITVKNIPPKAYEYVVNGHTAIGWIMERYQVKTDKDSGIVNDPNDWAVEHNHPHYILDLLLKYYHRKR